MQAERRKGRLQRPNPGWSGFPVNVLELRKVRSRADGAGDKRQADALLLFASTGEKVAGELNAKGLLLETHKILFDLQPVLGMDGLSDFSRHLIQTQGLNNHFHVLQIKDLVKLAALIEHDY